MCFFDIFHTLPLIVMIMLLLSSQGRNIFWPASLALSILGLMGGGHVHSHHGLLVQFLDPCFIYVAIATVASVKFAISWYKQHCKQ